MFTTIIRRAAVVCALALTVPTIALAQGAKVALTLIGLAGQQRTLTADEFAKLPHMDATVSSHNVEGKYSGVSLGDLLKLVERPAGEALRGKALTAVISVEAADGYRVIFALAEVDSGFLDKKIFLADKRNGAPIDASEGPLRMIVPDEKRPARWAKQVVKIVIRYVD